MKIDHYIDDCFSIVDGTLLSCRNEHRKLVIPAEIDGHRIYRIGSGCSISGGTDTVIISEGIRELGREAFLNCPYLKRLELPESLEKAEEFGGLGVHYEGLGNVPVELFIRRHFSPTIYDQLLAQSIQLTSGERLLTGDYAELPQFCRILKSYGSLCPPASLNVDVGSLFILDIDKVGQLYFEGCRKVITDGEWIEHDEFIKRIVPLLIRKKNKLFWDNNSELAADTAMQCGEFTFPERVMLTAFRKEETIERAGEYSVCFHIFFGKVFAPAISSVRHKGQTAYVYSEMFLDRDGKRPFVRQTGPGKVFDEKGKRIEQDEIFAKYKLLAMLS